MDYLIKLLRDHNINLVFVECECAGFSIVEARTIFVQPRLKDLDVIEVVLHESKHILSHADYTSLYKASYTYHSKLECEAKFYAWDELIFMNGGIYNYSAFLEEHGIGMGYDQRYLGFKGL
ncbi:hypothetical protein [Enterococcus sp. 5H]|uniref:hypothetical protein n=1 Tax=Enterococcus sp. 5H TaxID=1229490 RepID=UPI002302B86A|nr:hypothetical protein [Enterococcus sp. 5H]MDA9472681.1 hypothetical protein [Enterococcus sp. 5H]